MDRASLLGVYNSGVLSEELAFETVRWLRI